MGNANNWWRDSPAIKKLSKQKEGINKVRNLCEKFVEYNHLNQLNFRIPIKISDFNILFIMFSIHLDIFNLSLKEIEL